jgi:outer membrane protein OmpA-like peptidoglycan-associated protein
MMKNLAAILTVFAIHVHEAPPADACGVKLTVKSSAPRKAVARTSNPSDVLLLGDPPRRLEADLTAAGHRVDVAPNPAAAKRKNYAVVITDPSMQDQARTSFASSVVIVRSGDVTADARSVEKQVSRKPVRTDEGRTVVAARPTRQPIAAGPTPDPMRRVVAAKEPTEAPPATDPTPTPTPTPPAPTPTPPAPTPRPPERVSTSVPKPAPEVKPAPVEPKPTPTPVAKASALPGEVYFTYNSNKVGKGPAASLTRAAKWLADNSDVQVVIEGHADPAGTPQDNMALAQMRAESVRDYLVSAGVDQSRLEVVSYGDTRLKYGRTDGRNRRVSIVTK